MSPSLEDVVIVAMPQDLPAARRLSDSLDVAVVPIEIDKFPDGETRLRIKRAASTVVLYCSLYQPDPKLFPLLLAASALRDLGASSIILVAPYLCYMRQDKAFRTGEPISQMVLGKVLSPWIDHIVTIEPHLHRTKQLGAVFSSISTTTISAAPLLAQLVFERHEKGNILLIGPDEEARAWTSAVAQVAGLPFATMAKIRHGDRDVEISLDGEISVDGKRVILVDDVISSGGTLAAAARALKDRGAAQVEALVVHALCSESDFAGLKQAGISDLKSTDTIPHASNALFVAPLIANSLHKDVFNVATD